MSIKCPQCDGPHTLSQCPTWRMPAKLTPAMHDAVFPKWTLCPDAMYIDLLAAMGLHPVPARIESIGKGEPCAPAILEALSYHGLERDDLTLDDAVKAFRFGYKEVRQRDDRAMLAQIIHLLASAPACTMCDGSGGWGAGEDAESCPECDERTRLPPRSVALDQLANPDPGPQEHEALADIHTDEKGT